MVYKLNGEKKVINLLDDKINKEENKKLLEKIKEPDLNIKCFKIIDDNRSNKKKKIE